MRLCLLALLGCAASDAPPPTAPLAPPAPASAPVVAPASPVAPAPAGWLRGSTHVHARPSGDSTEPIDNVLRWYETHGYDFIVLTDHNRVTDPDGASQGPAARVPAHGLLVLAGSELTNNPDGCQPAGDRNKCRIHVNAIGVTERPVGKIEWAERHSKQRIDHYAAAFKAAQALGAAVIQINHPNYYWGMTPELLVELGKRARLVEIANAQFEKWNAGDATHASVEAEWDAALAAGDTLWGVASDDAHDYADGHGKYPPGGGWVMVHAERDPRAILDALANGHFYASTGVTLVRAEVDSDELVVEAQPGQYTIDFIENGKVAASVKGFSAKHPVPQTGYVRAVVTRDDGKKAWVQPASRP